jgi:hypothetical protein
LTCGENDRLRATFVTNPGHTMTLLQERLLESKMTDIEQARSWSPRVISKFEALIRSGDDLSLYRINPLAFARDRGIVEAESVDLFLQRLGTGFSI